MSRDRERDEEDARFVAERLKWLCEEKFGGNATKFATAIGASPRNVQRWCTPEKRPDGTGRATPSLSEVLKIPRATDVSLDELMGLHMDPAQRLAGVADRAESMLSGIHEALDKLVADLASARAEVASRPEAEASAAASVDRRRQAAARRNRRHIASEDG